MDTTSSATTLVETSVLPSSPRVSVAKPSGSPAIRVEEVQVKFRPYVDRRPTLKRTIQAPWRSRTYERIVVLDQVSFTVNRGEAFGIVGRNGAGKSTLMRVMAGTLRPNKGKVVMSGKASTLLQLGVGFNSELSGRRNIYLGGLATGLRKAAIDAKFDEIVEYAELGDAIDRPLKTYSAGMFARLAFSVGMHLDPEIVLFDEILSVGDEGFRVKSIQTMTELLERAGTIVFVSHNLAGLAAFCDRAAWLDQGGLMTIGPVDEVIAEYRAFIKEMRQQDKQLPKAP